MVPSSVAKMSQPWLMLEAFPVVPLSTMGVGMAGTKRARNSSEPIRQLPLELLCTPYFLDALTNYDVVAVMRELLRRFETVTQARLARVLGFDASYINMLVNPNDKCTIRNIDDIRRVAPLLGVPAELLGPGAEILRDVGGTRALKVWWDADPALIVGLMERHIAAEFTRRNTLAAIPVATGAALTDSLQGWATARPSPLPKVDDPGHGTIDDEIGRLRDAIQVFREWDFRFGGGLRRRAVVGQLSEVLEMLNQRHPARVTRQLFSCAAELALRVGWMAFDLEHHGVAQHHFTLALRAAKEGGDSAVGAQVLACMAVQMLHVQQPDDALDLVHLAQYGARRGMTPALESMLYTVEARAYASLPTPSAERCRRTVELAWKVYGDVDPATEPAAIRFFDKAELAGTTSLAMTELAHHDKGQAEEAASLRLTGIDLLDHTYTRTYAFNLTGLVNNRILQREPIEASKVGHSAVKLAHTINSERVNVRLRESASLAMQQFPDMPEVLEFHDSVAALSKTAA